jgi:hypothetical protein
VSRARRICLAAALVLASIPVGAQVNNRQRPAARRPVEEVLPGDAPQARRRMLEQQIRQRLWRIAKNRLALNEAQMARLEQVTQRFDQRRRALGEDERAQRLTLRSATLADSAVNQNAIAAALDQMQQIHRQRLELQAEEQRELATFMTPLQRARFMALQEEFRRRMQDLQKARPGGPRPEFQSP